MSCVRAVFHILTEIVLILSAYFSTEHQRQHANHTGVIDERCILVNTHSLEPMLHPGIHSANQTHFSVISLSTAPESCTVSVLPSAASKIKNQKIIDLWLLDNIQCFTVVERAGWSRWRKDLGVMRDQYESEREDAGVWMQCTEQIESGPEFIMVRTIEGRH